MNKYFNEGFHGDAWRKSVLKPIIQLNPDGSVVREWESIKAACDTGKFVAGGIIKCCKGRQGYHKNFQWRYKNE